jgi:hypothetical protein
MFAEQLAAQLAGINRLAAIADNFQAVLERKLATELPIADTEIYIKVLRRLVKVRKNLLGLIQDTADRIEADAGDVRQPADAGDVRRGQAQPYDVQP